MSRHFAFSQVIAIGQPFMPNARQLQLRTPAIDALARHATQVLPPIGNSVQELNGLLMVLAQASRSSQFTFGTTAQRQAWGLFWQTHALQLQQYVQAFLTAKSSLQFTDWLSRQPLPDATWTFLSMALQALTSMTTMQPQQEPANTAPALRKRTEPRMVLVPDFILFFPSQGALCL